MTTHLQITEETRRLESEEHDEHGEHSLSLVQLKVLFLILILIVGFSAFLPLKFSKLKPNSLALGYTNCVTAGFFLCIAILHMLPESAE